jgi:hypothetical protein
MSELIMVASVAGVGVGIGVGCIFFCLRLSSEIAKLNQQLAEARWQYQAMEGKRLFDQLEKGLGLVTTGEVVDFPKGDDDGPEAA